MEIDVSTLVLMDSWIKTKPVVPTSRSMAGFNPCFNGFMDKDRERRRSGKKLVSSFNPCFNGFMDKDTREMACKCGCGSSFNPCFNGFMDKDVHILSYHITTIMFQPLF